MTPWSETEVVVTGLKGGVGALLARDALLRGAKKVWLHHPSSKKTEIDAGDLEVSCGILRASDVGESDVASAFARIKAIRDGASSQSAFLDSDSEASPYPVPLQPHFR